jgi:hypothetical protein
MFALYNALKNIAITITTMDQCNLERDPDVINNIVINDIFFL